jgi:glycosyltransferase involved in cell wall biosynthesis
MAKIRPDIVHAITIKPNIYAGMCANKLGIPSIKSVTGLGAVYTSRKLIFRLLKPLIECLYKFVGCSGRGVFIFENSSDYSVFQNYHLSSAQELQHIPGAGVDLDAFRFHPKAEVGREVSVLFAARLLKDKGLGALVGAVEIVNQSSLIPVKLLVAGIFDHDALDAYTEQEIESLATAGKIQWLGKCDDMPQLLERVDIVALPTCYGEGIPRVLIEAGAVGRVVVCSNVPGCNEFVEHRHNGLLVPPHNTNALSSALLELINSSGDREKFSRNLRKKVELEYSNGAVISSFLATYSRLL